MSKLEQCPHCGGSLKAESFVDLMRRGMRRKAWGSSPTLWLGALTLAELDRLKVEGLAELDSAGWHIPTAQGRIMAGEAL